MDGITPFLTPPAAVAGKPYPLAANAGKSFIGSYVLGMGFVLTPEEAEALIARDRRNRDVLFPYLNGEDLNSRPDQSPSRWVINFRDWPLRRGTRGRWSGASNEERVAWLRAGVVPDDYPDPVAADYPDCLNILEEKVKPERDRLASGDATARDRARRWWQFARPTIRLYRTLAGMDRVLPISSVAKHPCLAFLPAEIVFDHNLTVVALSAWSHFAVLQSALHLAWAAQYSSTLETRIGYRPSDAFDTYPFPAEVETASLERIGERYHRERQWLTDARHAGLTKIYNSFHHLTESGPDISQFRDVHVEMDRAVAAAYGWIDLDLGHGFHETKQGLRFTIREPARQEVLARLLRLNHARYQAEVRQGLHAKKKRRARWDDGDSAGPLFVTDRHREE